MNPFMDPLSRKEALEILAEVINDRAKRKRGEAVSPAEELLLNLLTCADGSYVRRKSRHKLIILAKALKLWPLPEWFLVKQRFNKVDYFTYGQYEKISWSTLEILIE